MADGMAVLPLRPGMKRRTIKRKIQMALLALSLLPLILFLVITHSVMVHLREDVKTELVHHTLDDLSRLARTQSAIANGMLDKVEIETQTAGFFARALLRNPTAFGITPSYTAAETPEDQAAATKYALAPDVSLATVKPELDLTSNLDKLFALIKTDDPSVEDIVYGTQSGILRTYPWNNDPLDSLEFTLAPAFAQQLDKAGEIAAPLRQEFAKNNVPLSRHAAITTVDPGNQWVIWDSEVNRKFSVRHGETGLQVYSAYDPRIRPWYLDAVARGGIAWVKYPDWGGGKFVFTIGKELQGQIPDKVSPGLAKEFRQRQIILRENSPLSVGSSGKWILQDLDGNDYEIRQENGKLNVYGIDILTCSEAVPGPDGHPAGAVGLDVSMESVRQKIIHTPDDIEGSAFLLNERGQLIDQERPDMFVPRAGGTIRAKMTAGETGTEHAVQSANYVAFAPIRSIHAPNGKSFWSIGISMPEQEITLLADEVQQRMVFMLELLAGLCMAMTVVVFIAAFWISRGITGPIVALGMGATRIGSGDLDYRLDIRTDDEIEGLADTFNRMAGDLKTYIKNLRETTAEKERFESELNVAHDIQMSFLKEIFPAFPDRRDFSIYASIKTAREVGGDLYDFILIDDTRLVFYVGDVSDKGVPASLVMAVTMTLMKRASEQPGIMPAEILRQVNTVLAKDNENCMFVTLFIAILELATGEMLFSNAGHNPPLILRADGSCHFLTLPDGLVLGVMTEAEYRSDSIHLEHGDMIVIYTDGVTEAMNPARELYSDARLQQTVARLAGSSTEEVVCEIITSVKVHAAGAPQSDDIAVLALTRT